MSQEAREGRSAARRSRPSNVARQTDIAHIAHRDLAVHRITRRLGCSVEVASLVAQLAGLGPQEAVR